MQLTEDYTTAENHDPVSATPRDLWADIVENRKSDLGYIGDTSVQFYKNYFHEFCRQTRPTRKCRRKFGNLHPQIQSKVKTSRLIYLTLTTLPSWETLYKQKGILRDNLKKLKRSTIWLRSLIGGIYFYEDGYNEVNEHWTPHIHIIAEVSEALNLKEFKEALEYKWFVLAGALNINIQEVGDSDIDVEKLSRYSAKRPYIAVANNEQLLREWASAHKNKRPSNPFGSWCREGFTLLGKPIQKHENGAENEQQVTMESASISREGNRDNEMPSRPCEDLARISGPNDLHMDGGVESVLHSRIFDRTRSTHDLRLDGHAHGVRLDARHAESIHRYSCQTMDSTSETYGRQRSNDREHSKLLNNQCERRDILRESELMQQWEDRLYD